MSKIPSFNRELRKLQREVKKAQREISKIGSSFEADIYTTYEYRYLRTEDNDRSEEQ